MINIKANNEKFVFDGKISLKDLMKKSNIISKNIISAYVNDKLVDLSHEVTNKDSIKFLTINNDESINILRHSCAHLLAHALKELFENIHISIGPVIENGFYYDFSFEDDKKKLDLYEIEKKMHEIARRNLDIEKLVLTKNDAIHLFKNEKYKLRLINEINENEIITAYKQGDFFDLCRGPHIPNTKILNYFKLLKISGAYWKGDSKNEMLHRIYGTIYRNEKELKEYLNKIEEIKKRDHRKIGKNLDLFHFRKDASGVVFWHNKGWNIYINIISYMRNIFYKNEYLEINTPLKLDYKLFEKSGHIEKFKENMFQLELNNNKYVLKPMNCPCHIEIFINKTKSYRDLPLRFAEFGTCFRNELSGALYGLMRLKSFVQDDGHIFCTEEQIETEVKLFIEILKNVYIHFGFHDFEIVFSKRPKNKIGEESIWENAEKHLKSALDDLKLNYTISNDGAFYGPKLEFILKDNVGRSWQCGTIQVDFFTAKRLCARYTNEKGELLYPIILHRAILGSIERFIGILLESNKGNLPFWLSPIQLAIVNINDACIDYSQEIYDKLKINYKIIRNFKNEKISFKIREYTLQKIPYILIIGDIEKKNNTITFRQLDNNTVKNISLDKFICILKGENY